jgi:ankyrin repeat protein
VNCFVICIKELDDVGSTAIYLAVSNNQIAVVNYLLLLSEIDINKPVVIIS